MSHILTIQASLHFVVVDFYHDSASAYLSHLYDRDYAANAPSFPIPILDRISIFFRKTEKKYPAVVGLKPIQ
jgi:hypothetical protein